MILLALMGATSLLSGCAGCVFMMDYDENATDENMRKLEADRDARLRANPSISTTEYNAINKQTGASQVQQKPTIEELEKQIEEAKKNKQK